MPAARTEQAETEHPELNHRGPQAIEQGVESEQRSLGSVRSQAICGSVAHDFESCDSMSIPHDGDDEPSNEEISSDSSNTEKYNTEKYNTEKYRVNSLAPSSRTNEPSCDHEIADATPLSVREATPDDPESASAIDSATVTECATVTDLALVDISGAEPSIDPTMDEVSGNAPPIVCAVTPRVPADAGVQGKARTVTELSQHTQSLPPPDGVSNLPRVTLIGGNRFVVRDSKYDEHSIAVVVAVNTDATKFLLGASGEKYLVEIQVYRSEKDMEEAAAKLDTRTLDNCHVVRVRHMPARHSSGSTEQTVRIGADLATKPAALPASGLGASPLELIPRPSPPSQIVVPSPPPPPAEWLRPAPPVLNPVAAVFHPQPTCPQVVTAVIADGSHVLLLHRRLPHGGTIMVLPFARTQEGVEPLDSLRDAFEEQIGCFPESFGDVMRFYQSHIDQGVYRNCLFASDRRLRNLRHLLYSMMQRRTKAIADVFPEAVLVPWSSLSLVASNLDSPARQALEACMPHVRKTSIPLVAEQICPIWPRPTAVSILATKRAEVRLSQQSVVPSKLGGSVALPDEKDLISSSRKTSLAHCSKGRATSQLATGLSCDQLTDIQSISTSPPKLNGSSGSITVAVTRISASGAELLVQCRDGVLCLPSAEPGMLEPVSTAARRLVNQHFARPDPVLRLLGRATAAPSTALGRTAVCFALNMASPVLPAASAHHWIWVPIDCVSAIPMHPSERRALASATASLPRASIRQRVLGSTPTYAHVLATPPELSRRLGHGKLISRYASAPPRLGSQCPLTLNT